MIRKSMFAAMVLMSSLTGLLLAQEPGKVAEQTAVDQPNAKSDKSRQWTGTPHILIQPHSLSKMALPPADEPLRFGTESERLKGGEALFGQVAPAVVIVQCARSHGTGFLIDDAGLVLTNHHVIYGDAFVDLERQASFALVHLGQLKDDGRIHRLPDPVRAYVVAADPERDLALLQLEKIPAEFSPLPHLELAESNPIPDEPCAIVGHGSSTMPWSIRRGRVVNLGESPRDLIDVVMRSLVSSPQELEELDAQLEVVGSRDIVISDCPVLRGDSGGPLVNEDGRVIGVTFAVPRPLEDQKVAYHVALSEVREFLQLERAPTLMIPDAWLLEKVVSSPEARVLAIGPTQDKPIQFLFDLDGDTPRKPWEEGDVMELVYRRKFDAEVILHYLPMHWLAFYDTDNDGTLDMILMDHDQDPETDRRYRLQEGNVWNVDEPQNAPRVDPSLFEDKALRRRCAEMVKNYDWAEP